MTNRNPPYAGSAAFHEARRAATRYPSKGESKAQRVARKQRESVPLERAQRRDQNLGAYEKSADRMGYEHPVNRQALKDLNLKRK